MTIWEKAIVNMQKGVQKFGKVAALFSDRVRAEIEIARFRIRLDEINSHINDQYRLIGRRIVDLRNRLELPKTTEQLVKDEAIAMAFSEIEAREKEKIDVMMQIEHESAQFKPGTGDKEDVSE